MKYWVEKQSEDNMSEPFHFAEGEHNDRWVVT